MSKCVRSIGGEVLDEILRTPKFKNADYFFRQESVIAELKSLETDFCADPVFLKRIDALWLDWADRGLVSGPIPESVVVSPDILPKECVREVTVLIRKKLQDSFLKTANTQIRKTAEHLGITDYRGLLIIAADGNYSLPPYFVVQAVCEACRSVKPDGRSVYSGINSVLYISANRPAFVPWSHEDRGVFICQGIDNRPDVGEGLITRLMEAWVGESSRLLGGEGSLKKVDPGGDPNDIHYR